MILRKWLNFIKKDLGLMMGDMNCGISGLTTPLTIYGFGLRGSSVDKSTRKHRFRTQKPRKAL